MASDKLIVTTDGSHTVYSGQFNATYHSEHGAITESKVVFIEAGLEYFSKRGTKDVRIFEMGFGTGLNLHLSYLFSKTNCINIDYTTIEAFPLQRETWNSLNYASDKEERAVFNHWHEIPWGQKTVITPKFSVTKIHERIENLNIADTFDIIYYDAFAPGTQPELWGDAIIAKLHNMLNEGGILTTYCAQGAFKRCLKNNGFMIENLPGPPGKREIVRAHKI